MFLEPIFDDFLDRSWCCLLWGRRGAEAEKFCTHTWQAGRLADRPGWLASLAEHLAQGNASARGQARGATWQGIAGMHFWLLFGQICGPTLATFWSNLETTLGHFLTTFWTEFWSLFDFIFWTDADGFLERLWNQFLITF